MGSCPVGCRQAEQRRARINDGCTASGFPNARAPAPRSGISLGAPYCRRGLRERRRLSGADSRCSQLSWRISSPLGGIGSRSGYSVDVCRQLAAGSWRAADKTANGGLAAGGWRRIANGLGKWVAYGRPGAWKRSAALSGARR